MDKLISMTDFVISKWSIDLTIENRKLIKNYAEFLKQPLTLGMFVPIDSRGIFLGKLQFCCNGSDCGCMGMPVNVSSQEQIDEYYEAEIKVLFEGCFYNPEDDVICYYDDSNSLNFFGLNEKLNFTIEDLIENGLKLTESAKKQILYVK